MLEVTVVVVFALFTVKALAKVAVPPPGGALVTEILRGPSDAEAEMVILAVREVELLTVVELILISGPKLTELTLLRKLVPVNTTFSVWSRFPLSGDMLINVGEELFTIKVCAFDSPPPGEGLKTVILKVPALIKSFAKMENVS